MSVPGNNYGVPREGAPVAYQPRRPHNDEKQRLLKRLSRSLIVLVVLSAVAFGTVKVLSDSDPWRGLLGGLAASDLNTGSDPGPAKPPVGGSGQAAPTTGAKDAVPGGVTTPTAGTGSGQAPTTSKPAEGGQGGASTPAAGASSGQADPATPVVASIKMLVNRTHPLPATYVPELVRVNARLANGVTPDEKLMQPEAAKALESMLQTAEQEKVILYCVSGYRSYATQKWLYEYRVKTEGQTMADLYTARPGQSEHQTGLAMDLANGLHGELSDAFGETAEGKWLVKNAHNFGFIIRYPQGREKTTGYNYEPWHLRYVGVEVAKAIASQGLVLEEYVN